MSKLSDSQTDLVVRLQSIALFGENKVTSASDPEDLANFFRVVKPPIAGVVYEGMRAQPEVSGTPRGLATTAVFAVYLRISTPVMTNASDPINRAMDVLQSMRDVILGKVGPAGHPWKFVFEAFVDSDKGTSTWVQRWETAVINQIVSS